MYYLYNCLSYSNIIRKSILSNKKKHIIVIALITLKNIFMKILISKLILIVAIITTMGTLMANAEN
ncbi:MAG: hypothetical protein RR667_03800, partial [Muribaculaceae bacterium]